MRKKKKKSGPLLNYIKWQPPDENMWKLNFDGTFKNTGYATTCFVIREWHVSVKVSGSFSLGFTLVLQDESMALKYGL